MDNRRVNWRRVMLEEIEKNREKKPRLLLHVCCAPCSSGCLEELSRYFEITLYYYNPNISPLEEYEKRAAEIEKLLSQIKLDSTVKSENGEYEKEKFDEISKGREELPEGGERCYDCYRLRLEKTAEKAADEGYEYFTTTLSVSPYKNADKLNEIGGELAAEYGVKYLFSDFKKNEGYKLSIENSEKYGLYRQNYCGCEFSKRIYESKINKK